MCSHHLSNGPLVCSLPNGHQFGHVYVTGSAVDDRHSEGGHG